MRTAGLTGNVCDTAGCMHWMCWMCGLEQEEGGVCVLQV